MLKPGSGKTWYVAVGGSDSADGSSSAPFATLQKAFDAVQPGQNVLVRAGTYTIQNEMILKNKTATSTAPIFIRGEGLPVFKAASSSAPGVWNAMIHIERSSNIQINGIRVENSSFFGFKVDYSDNIELIGNQSHISLGSAIYGSEVKNLKVINNDVSRFCDKNAYGGGAGCNEGISFSFVDGFDVRGNLVHDAPQQPDVGPGGGEGIDIKTGSRNGYVRHNKVWDLVQIGIYLDGWEQGVENVEVFGNQVWKTYTGIVINSEQGGPVRNVRVYNNLVRDVGYDGIAISSLNKDSGGDGPRENIQVYNNTIVNAGVKESKPPFCKLWTGGKPCEDYGTGIVVDTANIKDFGIWDNVIVGSKTATISVPPAIRGKLTVKNNLVWPVQKFAWTDEFNGDGAIGADPKLVNLTSDFRPSSSSPAIGKGQYATPPKTDLSGITRGKPSDLGAFQAAK
jgi:Right handed beta helix region